MLERGITDSQSLKRLFPSDGTLPEEHRLAAQIHQRAYLINGRLQLWEGPCKAVLSPVCRTLADGTVRQVPIGCYLEMGVAQSDAALDAAVRAYEMLMVHRSIVDAFLERFTAELARLKVGMPWESGVHITPLPGPHRTAYMTEAIEDAKARGARVVNEGGGAFCSALLYPAVVYPVREVMKLYREEQFGPVVPVLAFDDVQEALDYVMTSDHGQQVSLFGSDAAEIGALVDPLVNQVCRVNINCQCQRGPDVFPFAGRKDSAEGTLSVSDALRAFSIRSMVATRQTEPNKQLLNAIVHGHQSKFINTGFIL